MTIDTSRSEEQLSLPDDEGGVPFDDEFDFDEPGESTDRGGGPAYDSGKVLVARGIEYPSVTPVGMKELKSYTLSRWGGADLGILSKPPRTIRGGSLPSLHNWGMAWDWRWANPGNGRGSADDVIRFCIDHAVVLGVQAVHDYEAGRYWKSYAGWAKGTPSTITGMCHPWAQWLHIERTWAAANDARSIDVALNEGGQPASGASEATKAAEVTNATKANGSGSPVLLPEPEIAQSATGANVARLQDFLRQFGFASFTRSDGVFGPKTFEAVKAAQQHFADKGWYPGNIDGVYGPKSAAAAARILAAVA